MSMVVCEECCAWNVGGMMMIDRFLHNKKDIN